jgi:hypothetical protein
MILGEYSCLIVIVSSVYNRGYCLPSHQIEIINCGEVYDGKDENNLIIIKSCHSFFFHSSFERCYQCTPYSWIPYGNLILLITRSVSFLYFFIVPFLLNYIKGQGINIIFFTMWQINITTLYFLLATIASILGVKYDDFPESNPFSFPYHTIGWSRKVSSNLPRFRFSPSLTPFSPRFES